MDGSLPWVLPQYKDAYMEGKALADALNERARVLGLLADRAAPLPSTDDRIASALERIADALDRMAPPK